MVASGLGRGGPRLQHQDVSSVLDPTRVLPAVPAGRPYELEATLCASWGRDGRVARCLALLGGGSGLHAPRRTTLRRLQPRRLGPGLDRRLQRVRSPDGASRPEAVGRSWPPVRPEGRVAEALSSAILGFCGFSTGDSPGKQAGFYRWRWSVFWRQAGSRDVYASPWTGSTRLSCCGGCGSSRWPHT